MAVQRGLGQQAVRRHEGVQAWLLFPAFMLLLVEATLRRRRPTLARAHATEAPSPTPSRWTPTQAGWLVGGGGALLVVLALVAWHVLVHPGVNGFHRARAGGGAGARRRRDRRRRGGRAAAAVAAGGGRDGRRRRGGILRR
ncbi:MAG: hypothetical protein R2939_06435 [Kofleriaceae bacterium]